MEAEQNKYVKYAPKVLNTFWNLHNRNSWINQLTRNGVELSSTTVDNCPFPAYHVKATFNKTREEMVNKIWGVDSEVKAKKNDPKLVTWKCVERGPNWKVIDQTNSAIWPIWPRQITFSQVRIDDGRHTYLIGTTTEHNDAVDHSYDHVTAHLHMSVYDYCDNGDGTTTVDRVVLLDPKGNIPVGLVTMYSKNQIDLFSSWKDE